MHMKVSPIIWKLDLSCKTLNYLDSVILYYLYNVMCELYTTMSCIGVGTGGTCPPPQQAGKGGSAPTARAMPIHAVLGLTMRHHIKFQE